MKLGCNYGSSNLVLITDVGVDYAAVIALLCLGHLKCFKYICVLLQNRERASALLEVASAMTGIGIVIHEAVIQASPFDRFTEAQRLQPVHVRTEAEDCWRSTC